MRPETKKNSDAEPQKKLAEPPQVIKAVYATSWSAGTPSRINYLTDLIKTTELNAIVIDIKDYSGNVTYNTEVEEVKKYGAREIRIPRINSLIKKLHEDNIYVIGRVTVFQDPILAAARPDLAIKNKTTGKIWTDRKGLGWIDPGSKEYWDYIVKIAKDAEARGIDEINFDYIRFPSDGDLSEMVYQFYDEKKERKEDVIAEFFRYLRFNLKDEKISADLFGLATIQKDDLGIGQVIESAYASFDYVSPMVYPSHYAAGFLGYKNPTNFPYEVVKYSMEKAEEKFLATGLTTSKLRPWLQDFDLGANYGPTEVKAQFKALADAGVENGWMLWDPSNVYTKEALILN
ncbi:MAG: putative glycoside hydrolase [Candidatus Colwellbacteria bacterium]|nr:putative glycoside hydrolase [Candidatus Colwellbacteria bacterium]